MRSSDWLVEFILKRAGGAATLFSSVFPSMKTSSLAVLFLVLLIPGISAPSATAPVPAATPYRVVERGADHQVWQRETYEPKANGTFTTRIHQYTELATGMNYWDNGQWQESKAEIDLLPGGSGAVATKGQHQVFFPPDIYSGAIELVTRDGKHLFARPLGISYDDGSNFVMIATLTNSVGQILPSGNQVIYPNAFSGFAADLVCTYRKSGFECDLVFREQPPTPKEVGLFQKTTRIQLLTEFFNTFDPDQINETDNLADGLTDQTLTFGKLKMVPGRAFMVGDNSPAIPNPAQSIKVSKQWLKLEGRKFLVEEVPYRKLRDQLQTLPSPGTIASTATTSGRLQLSMKRVLPAQRPIEPGVSSMQLAAVDWKEKLGVVLDYTTVNANVTNFTFQGDTTYFINGEYNLYGTTTIEGGAVIKYGPASISPSMNVYGAVNCLTAPYRPVIFTGKDDNSVGEPISGSTGSPSGTYANRALDCFNSVTLKNLRMSYVNFGVVLDGGSNNVVQDCQFLKCSTPVRVYQSADTRLLNVLFGNVAGTAINSYQSTVTAEQVTAHKVGLLWTNDSSTFNLTNSLLIGVTNLGSTFNGGYNSTNASDAGIFQTVGGGDHYLATNSPYHNAGTTNIIPALRANLAGKTTYPPVIFVKQTFSTATNLYPQAQRDTNSAPDLGYHYDPLDYVFGGCDLYTNLTLTAGTVIAFYQDNGSVYSNYQPYGISLNDGANLLFEGTVAQPCQVVSYSRAVQEGVNGSWLQAGWMGTIMINGSGSGFFPQITSHFTKWNTIASGYSYFRDNWNYGIVNVSNSEFNGGGFCGYAPSMYFTNCLFNRTSISYWDDRNAPNLTFLNCTFFNGMLEMKRYSWESPSFWLIKNCAFDGTMFNTFDELNANTNSTSFDCNSYNTANTSWMTYPFSWISDYGHLIPNTNVLEIVGLHDLAVTNYNWQTNRLGNFYLPSNSPLINAGSIAAYQVGLYHFTTQTSQIKETNSIVDIGYHYVAVDSYGNPLDNNGSGIPDYLEGACPSPPIGLTATGTNQLINLFWSSVGDANAYKVKRASVSGGPYTTIQSGVTTNKYADSYVTNGTMYYYVVSAVNDWGEGANSTETSASLYIDMFWTGIINNIHSHPTGFLKKVLEQFV